MDHTSGFDVTAHYHNEAPPATADREPLTPAHHPGFLDGLLPFYDPDGLDLPYDLNQHHFDDAYPPSPSPPRQAFLDNILNPAGLDHNRYSPFVYRNSPPTFPPRHTILDDMPPYTRTCPDNSSARPARLPNGYVDLTATPDSPTQRRKRPSPTPGPSAKRQKRHLGSAARRESSGSLKVEEVDLTDERLSVRELLQKQREDAVKSQTRPEEKPTTFNTFTCVICMDNPTDLTATACGHLFCHTCLNEALIAGENRAGHGEPRRSQCPVCRKFINRSKTTDIIPLLLKKGLATQPRKRKIASPAAVAPKVATTAVDMNPTSGDARRSERSYWADLSDCICISAIIMTSSCAGDRKKRKGYKLRIHSNKPHTNTLHPPSAHPRQSVTMPPNPKLTSQIAIVGAGDVGATIAYSLIMNSVAGDILMIDPKEEVRDAQIQDLSDATFHGNTSTRIRAGTHKEAGQADIIVMTAGAKQKKGESRADLIGRNKSILESAIADMKPLRSDTILLLVANPVDALTYFAQQYAALPKTQVLGSGTFLDSARLRGILAQKAGVAPDSVDAYVLGEHGETQFVAWSCASIGGIPLDHVLTQDIDKQAVADDVKNKATSIIENKGVTNYGIGAVAASICKSILGDERVVRAVSHWQEELGVCLSLPAVLGREGVARMIKVPMSEGEKVKLRGSAEALREMVTILPFPLFSLLAYVLVPIQCVLPSSSSAKPFINTIPPPHFYPSIKQMP
ncbi:hypothetical protein CC86DRAFT_460949 [Ophiobolus disseminans]|uniref:RING-type domain-containing protein n=1 Tax=Ophiobolus disseminans TaxID=1469910 RepID=A0A6A6ZD26_9PLEO|nr:hypothetical protein CC86DRAFT_460949 [Ophiobolus disseminans]